jgi:glycosyltransferase A (GT-A) superfamily protein (DUF2064 family)
LSKNFIFDKKGKILKKKKKKRKREGFIFNQNIAVKILHDCPNVTKQYWEQGL